MKKLLAAAAMAGAGLCFGLTAAAAENIRLLLDWVPDAGTSPVYLAKERGWYEKAGINLIIEFGKGSALSAQAVGSGAVPLAVSDLPTAMVAIGKGADIIANMSLSSYSPQGFYWLKSSGISGPRDFNGRSIGNPPGDSARAMWPAFAKAAGIDATTVKFVNVAPQAKSAALQSRQVDIITEFYTKYELYTATFGNDLGYASYRQSGLNVYGKAVLTNTETMRTKQDLIKRVVAVTQRAYAECLIDATPCLAALVKNVSAVNLAVSEGEWRRLSELMVSNDWKEKAVGWLDAQRVKADYDLIVAYMGVDKPYDPLKSFTPDLLDRSIKLSNTVR
jgi:NitT/TauT family transport system substrate-binding protein